MLKYLIHESISAELYVLLTTTEQGGLEMAPGVIKVTYNCEIFLLKIRGLGSNFRCIELIFLFVQ